jgi:glycosyltransferase involved in cell wall biosynthesis
MSKLIFVPIERLEQRYTGMVYDILAPHFDMVISPKYENPRAIQNGEFLDICGTIQYKSAQLNIIAGLFDNGDIEDGDVFLFGDIFFPGLESIKYMAELLGITVKIAAFNHAGRADETDFVQKLGAWSDHSERGWHDACDLILVGSEYHRHRVTAYFKQPPYKVKNTGQPWSPEWCEDVLPNYTLMPNKEPFVIWPHRMSFEKGVDVLYRYALQTSREIYITSCGKRPAAFDEFMDIPNVKGVFNLSKTEYYAHLNTAEFYLSTARQETFGYTLQEALYYGCKPLAPNKACYNEFLPIRNLYDTESQIDEIFDHMSAGHYRFKDGIEEYKLPNNVNVIMDAVKSLR